MKTKLTQTLLLFFSLNTFHLSAQTDNVDQTEKGGEYPIGQNDASNPCLTPEQYLVIKTRCMNNAKLYIHDDPTQKSPAAVLFSWPLQPAPGYNECSYYFWGAHVDQNPAAGSYSDYNCGTLTYDAHQGTDIPICPYPFYKMDHDQIQVIAAAAGTIVDKVDGNFDKNCAASAATPNYIAIQHSDGSIALYLHMKMNSLTSKIVGQTVAVGEFLGIVGSSGSSSAPHLHFEVWAGSTSATLNDPFTGTCNALNPSTWWISQKAYTEPAIITASVNTAAPVLPACPATETPNEDSCFTGGTTAKFVIFIRNETTATTVNMRIVNPGGSTFTSWTHNCVSTYSTPSYYYWTKTLPTTAGTYTFETTYNSIVCSKQFKINCVATGIAESADLTGIRIYPNPFSSSVTIQFNQIIHNGEITIYNVFGQIIKTIKNISGQEIKLNRDNLSAGIYFISLAEQNKIISTNKLVITD
ncbi:MAG: peptidoglycan DD-metalloendopeptidase family protein [Bacteroidia bacterium]